MRLIDVITIAALIIGPALAVAIQLGFERRKESRNRKLQILDTLMAYRRRLVHSDSVAALNRIDTVFYDDPTVRAKFKNLLDHLDGERIIPSEEKAGAWAKRDDLLVDLLSEMASVMGYKFDHTHLKNMAYNPQAYVDEHQYTENVRKGLMALLEGKAPIVVSLTDATQKHKQEGIF